MSAQNYQDKTVFSGTLYNMYRALSETDLEIIPLGNHQKYFIWRKISQKIQQLLRGFTQQFQDEESINDEFSDQVNRQLRHRPCDIIFAPVASEELFFLNPTVPVCYLSDATVKLIAQTYNQKTHAKHAQEESFAIAKATKLIYSSHWAAKSAITDYRADPSKLSIVPFGANIEKAPEIEAILEKCYNSRCRLLFIGADWKRKGGQIAIDTLLSLLALDIDAELVILGCVPPGNYQHPRLTVIPWLNKNRSQDRKIFNQLLLNSHFLLLPTRADCSPIVLCEASAYGIPAITTDVGGIPDIIEPERNGFMLPSTATGKDYAAIIADCFMDKDRYYQLVKNARQEYETRLNWKTWAEQVSRNLREMADESVLREKIEQPSTVDHLSRG